MLMWNRYNKILIFLAVIDRFIAPPIFPSSSVYILTCRRYFEL